MSEVNLQHGQLLLQVKRKNLLGFLQNALRTKRLEIFVSTLIVIGLIFGGYRLFMGGGHFLLRQGELGEIFMDRMFYLGWSIIFYLLILSNLITGFSTFYRSPEVAYLMTMPVGNRQIFKIKFVENLVYSSWAILILGIPLTLGYGALQGLQFWQYLLIFAFGILPFLFIATVSATLLLGILVYLSRFFKMRTLFIMLGVLFTGFFYLYFNISQQDTLLTSGMGNFRALGRYMSNLSSNPFPIIPSYWLSQLFLNSDNLALAERIYYAALFVTTAAIGWEINHALAHRFYFQTYQVMEGQGQKNKLKPISKIFKAAWPGLEPRSRALLSKELVQFMRTPQQWVQFLLMAFFISVYLINLSRGKIQMDELAPVWRTALYVFNFGFMGFILAALTARFVYPMISMEGRSLWILQAAPFSMTQVFKEKFWFAFFVLFSMTEVVTLASNYFLGQPPMISFLASLFLFLTSLALISLSLGLGAVYAQFNETNPMKISSGYGGIITVILSLIYVAFSVTSLILLINVFQAGGSSYMMWGLVIFMLVLTTIYTWLPLKWGIRAVSHYEP